MMKWFVISIITVAVINAQGLPPKQPYATTVKQIHSGHSLTDPLFYPHWPGQYVNLMGSVNAASPGQLVNTSIGKSTTPGSSMKNRWEKPPGFNAPDARGGIANWEVLCITERVPLYYDGGSTQEWYKTALAEQREMLSLFVNNAWTNGNGGKGAPTLLWTTWVQIDSTAPGSFRSQLDVQGVEWERMQDYANDKRPSGAPPVYLIPGHKMMARLYDDIRAGKVPGVTDIRQFFSDNIHTNELGAYAISMIHYACLYNRSPVGLPSNLLPNAPSGTPIPSAELAAYIQTMVWEVVTGYARTGVGTTSDVGEGGHEPSVPKVPLLSPNPATNHLYVRYLPETNSGYDAQGDGLVRIFNAVGVEVITTCEHRMDISALPSGLYLVQVGSQRECLMISGR
jgi:hypothetical protein